VFFRETAALILSFCLLAFAEGFVQLW